MDSSLKQHKPCQWIIQDSTCWLSVLTAPGRQHWATHTTGSWGLTTSRTHLGPQNEEELLHKVLFSKSWWAMLQIYHARVTVLPASSSNYLSWAELIFNEHCGSWKGFFLKGLVGICASVKWTLLTHCQDDLLKNISFRLCCQQQFK